jgi:hypothetical protein
VLLLYTHFSTILRQWSTTELCRCIILEQHKILLPEKGAILVQARRQNASRAAAAKAMANADASGYGSDEEVYATARAVDDADGYDGAELADTVDKKKIEPLPALDHANIEYDDFVKNFYEELPALHALSFPEVGCPGHCHTRKTIRS